MRLWFGWVKERADNLIGWAAKKWEAIFVGVIIVILMGSLLLVQDIRHTTREIGHYNEKIQLSNVVEAQSVQLKQISEFSDFLSKMSQDLRAKNHRQQTALEEAASIINNQRAILERLIEYMKEIGEWPPKIDPPKPVDPDSIAGIRSEA